MDKFFLMRDGSKFEELSKEDFLAAVSAASDVSAAATIPSSYSPVEAK
jgi:hypothetical protein